MTSLTTACIVINLALLDVSPPASLVWGAAAWAGPLVGAAQEEGPVRWANQERTSGPAGW